MPPADDGSFLPLGWPTPPGVKAWMTTRRGGASSAPFDSLNLGAHVGDDPRAVAHNRERLQAEVGSPVHWLDQVHGDQVIDARVLSGGGAHRADAVYALEPGLPCAVLVADCLPVLLCSRDGRAVAAAHAGWRGMAAGVLARVVQRLAEEGGVDPGSLSAWLGPCIGPRAFEVGSEVREAFGPQAHRCFRAHVRRDGSAAWLCDLPGLARLQLTDAGVADIHGGHWCTVEGASDFFSFRRDRVCGRQAAVICRLA